MNSNETIAVNMMQLCKSDFIEFEKAVRKKTAQIAFMTVVICGAIIYAAAVYSLIREEKLVPGVLIGLVTFCLVLAVFTYVIVPDMLGNMRYKQYCTMHGSDGKIVFYSDRFCTMAGAETVQTLLYKDMRRVVQTEHLLIMEFSNHVYSFVRKDAFSEGNAESLLQYMQDK